MDRDAGHRLTVRDLDPGDVAVLKDAAARSGRSLNAYIGKVLHERARAEHNRALLAALDHNVPAALADFDAAAEVRAVRDEQEARDDQRLRSE